MLTMTTMTDKVFEGYADKARTMGRVHGLKDRAAYIQDWGHGPEEAQSEDCLHDLPSPLSGEWFGDLTPGELLYQLGLTEVHPEDADALCDTFEDAHNAALFGDN